MFFQFLDFELDPLRFQLRRGGSEVPIARQTFDLILLLIRHRDRPVTKSEILDTVWPGRTVTPASLTHAIAEARRALGDTAEAQAVIKTVHGRGYWWVVETREARQEPPESAGEIFPFVGRSRELAALRSFLDDARAGRGSLALLVGEAGIGKTRLAERFFADGIERGFTVLAARCIEDGGAPAGWPWVQILRALLTSRPARSDPSVRREASIVNRFFPEIAAEPRQPSASHDGKPERFVLFDSIWRLVAAASRQTPLLLALDDVHLADALSGGVLSFCARQMNHERVLLLATARDGVGVSNAVAGLAREPRARTVVVGGLSESDVGPLFSSVRAAPEESLRRAIFERSGGNPFFLTQIVGALRSADDAAVDQDALLVHLPGTVREAVARQLHDLPFEALTTLEAASVQGPSFGAALLAEVLAHDTQSILETLENPTCTGLVTVSVGGGNQFHFRHSIVRDVMYERLPSIRRRELHRAYAAAFESRGATTHSSAISHHLRSAYPLVTADKVALATVLAARDAFHRAAFLDAVQTCSAALSLLKDDRALSVRAKCELLSIQAAALLLAGKRAEGRASLRSAAMLAREFGLSEQLAGAALAIAPGFFAIETGIVDFELIDALEEALRALPQEDSVVRVRLLGNLATSLYWSPSDARRRATIEEASAVAKRLGTIEALAHACASSYTAEWSPMTLERRLAEAGNLIDLVDRSRDQDLRLMARVFRIATFMEAGSAAKARQEISALTDLVRTSNHPHALWYLPMYEAMWEITRGRLSSAVPLIQQFLEQGSRLQDANVVQTFLLQTAEISWQSGRTAEILGQVEANVARNPNLREWECAHAFLLARAGMLDDARRLATRLLTDGDMVGRMNETIGLAALAECCLMLGDRELAVRLRPRMGSRFDRMVVAGYGVLCWGSFSRAAGHVSAVLGILDEAEQHYLRAAAAERCFEANAWLSRTLNALSNVYSVRDAPGDEERKLTVRREIRDLAHTLGIAEEDR